MSISYVEGGRTRQKQRTHDALVGAARELIGRGRVPTVEEAAEAAGVSRATAYRYYPNRQELLVAAHPEVEAESLLGLEPPAAIDARLDLVALRLGEIFLAAEESYRAMLRLSLESRTREGEELALRKGRRFLWIEEALAPLRKRLPRSDYERLVNAVAATIGIEALVALTDLAGLTPERAVEVMRWAAQALLRTTLSEEVNGDT